jgi:hypothetical protein
LHLLHDAGAMDLDGLFPRAQVIRACYALCIVVGTLEVWNENLTPVMLVMTNGPLWLPI